MQCNANRANTSHKHNNASITMQCNASRASTSEQARVSKPCQVLGLGGIVIVCRSIRHLLPVPLSVGASAISSLESSGLLDASSSVTQHTRQNMVRNMRKSTKNTANNKHNNDNHIHVLLPSGASSAHACALRCAIACYRGDGEWRGVLRIQLWHL